MPHIKEIPGQFCVAFDQCLNVLVGGWADETFSSRCFRQGKTSRFWAFTRRVVDGLFFFQPNHCETAYWRMRNRAHCPPEVRESAK